MILTYIDCDESNLDIANSLFSVKYKSRTMYEFLNSVCNWCTELGLVDRIKSGADYDTVYLTPLGIESTIYSALICELRKVG